jgi:hypothetical protein
MSTKRFYRRRFLNRRGFHAGAYVLAACEIVGFRSTDGVERHNVDAELAIADCGRVASLDFCVHSEAAARNALHKAHQLRDVVVDFTAALEAAVEEWREHQS